MTSAPVRVAHLITGDAMYGLERGVLAGIAKTDPSRVASVAIVVGATAGHDTVARIFRQEAVEAAAVVRAGRLSGPMIRDVRTLLSRHRIDVIHTHGFKADVIGLCAGSGLIRVATLHGWSRGERRRVAYYEAIGRLCIRRFDRIYTVSRWLLLDLLRRGFDPERTILARNGVDTARFDTVFERRALRPDRRTGWLTFVGRFTERKGVFDLLHAFKRARLPDSVKLQFVGHGPAGSALRAAAERSTRVVVSSFVDDIRPILSQSDAVVLPSYSEGIPRILMEALSAGVPVIASRIPGVLELVDEKIATLVPPGDVAALGAALERRYGETSATPDMTRRGRERVVAEFDVSRQAATFAADYERLVAAKRCTAQDYGDGATHPTVLAPWS